MPSADRNLSHLYPGFRSGIELILNGANAWLRVHRLGFKAIVTEGYRSTARQKELYAQGRTAPGSIVTQKNGTTNPSNHQSCCAADFALVSPSGELVWDDGEFWRYLGHLARANGLFWGGDWRTFKDLPHVEVPISNQEMYAAAREWKGEAGVGVIPRSPETLLPLVNSGKLFRIVALWSVAVHMLVNWAVPMLCGGASEAQRAILGLSASAGLAGVTRTAFGIFALVVGVGHVASLIRPRLQLVFGGLYAVAAVIIGVRLVQVDLAPAGVTYILGWAVLGVVVSITAERKGSLVA